MTILHLFVGKAAEDLAAKVAVFGEVDRQPPCDEDRSRCVKVESAEVWSGYSDARQLAARIPTLSWAVRGLVAAAGGCDFRVGHTS